MARPRVYPLDDSSPAARQRRSRATRRGEGGQHVAVMLTAEAASALAQLRGDTGETAAALISRLLVEAGGPAKV
jgi:hypothetical protein